jgi:hypothetical protein
MKADLSKELESTKNELVKTKSELKLVEDKLEYCQDRILDIRNENDILKKKINDYEILNVDRKLKEVKKLENDFLKQKHRLKITKDLLDDSRNEITLLKQIVQDFKGLSLFDFMRKKYPENINLHFIKYEKYSKHGVYSDKSKNKK